MHVSIHHLHDLERKRATRLPVAKLQLLVGSDAKCDLRIVDDPHVSPRHCTIAVRPIGTVALIVTPLAGATLVNGLVISEDTTTALGDTIQIGNTVLRFDPDHVIPSPVPVSRPSDPAIRHGTAVGRPPPPIDLPPSQRPTLVPVINANPPRPQLAAPPPALPKPSGRRLQLSADPTEDRFLQSLRDRPNDAATRQVYADWLEEKDLATHAELVRTARIAPHVRFVVDTEVAWRAIVCRAPIENCSIEKCPSKWDALRAAPDDDRARDCATCKRRVYFVDEAEVRRELDRLGIPYALDLSLTIS